jgi:hypothetical protein
MNKLLLLFCASLIACQYYGQYAMLKDSSLVNPFEHPRDVAGNREVLLVTDGPQNSPSALK